MMAKFIVIIQTRLVWVAKPLGCNSPGKGWSQEVSRAHTIVTAEMQATCSSSCSSTNCSCNRAGSRARKSARDFDAEDQGR